MSDDAPPSSASAPGATGCADVTTDEGSIPTLVLGATDIASLLDRDEAISRLRAGFLADHGDLPAQRVRIGLPGAGTATALLPGLLPGVPAYTVKVNAKFPAVRPALRGVVCLFSLTDGALLALLDSASLTAWRTGLAAAMATHHLAAPEATAIGLIGAGAQGLATISGIRHLRDVDKVVVHDPDPDAIARLRRQHQDVEIEVATSPAAVAAEVSVIILATWAHTPLLRLADVVPGQHVTSLGADEPGKAELAPDLLHAAHLVVDDVTLAATSGVLTEPSLRVGAIDLATALRKSPGTTGQASKVSVYSPVGLPWQDLALAWPLARAAQAGATGMAIDLLR